MERIAWCISQRNGLKKMEENPNLAKEYLDNAEESSSHMINDAPCPQENLGRMRDLSQRYIPVTCG